MRLSYKSKRAIRIGELIQRSVSEVIMGIKNFDMGFVTVMGVKITDDLLSCKVYYSVFGPDEDKKKIEKIFKKNTKEVRCQLALRLNLRRTPKIFFVYDYANESAIKVFDILKKIDKEKNDLVF
jgi:ribosome-binding factor A